MNLSKRFKESTTLKNVNSCAKRRIDVIGSPGEMEMIQQVAGYSQIKGQQKHMMVEQRSNILHVKLSKMCM